MQFHHMEVCKKSRHLYKWTLSIVHILTVLLFLSTGTAQAVPFSSWSTVVNNGDIAPDTGGKAFFSYNQPSINDDGLVVFRARAKTSETAETAGTESTDRGTASGIFTRAMSQTDAPITAVALRGGEVPAPNNIEATFNEFPSFPRIDATSDTFAFRGQSNPSVAANDTRSGTTGLYTTDGSGNLSTGIRNIEPAGGYPQYLVPGETDIRFDQFPGAPSPTDGKIAFKGNWTADGNGKTGVFYRDLADDGAGGTPGQAVVEIARRGDSIPDAALPVGTTSALFGSTSPPSAAAEKMVFTGLDNEDAPTAGGIFLADLKENSSLTTVAGFQTKVPNGSNFTLNHFGEGLSFDGRYVGFWAGWGEDTFSKDVECRTDGNAARAAACQTQSPDSDGKYSFDVIKNQGIFLADTLQEQLYLVAQTGDEEGDFNDFLFWNFSGSVEEDSEGPRWRSSAFLAIDGDDVVFKAQLNDNVHDKDRTIGLFGAQNVTKLNYDLFTILTTGMDGGLLDKMASGIPIAELGIERDGFRNGRLAINATMDDGENSWAGIYVAPVPEPGTWALLSMGLAGLAIWWRKNR